MSAPLVQRVRWSDVDANGHVRHTAYLEYGAEARMAWLAEAGFDLRRLAADGMGLVLLREEIDYRRELALGEEVRVTLRLAGLSPDAARWRVRHEVLGGAGQLAARIVAAGGFLDLERRKLVAPPPALAAHLAAAERCEEFERLAPLRTDPAPR